MELNSECIKFPIKKYFPRNFHKIFLTLLFLKLIITFMKSVLEYSIIRTTNFPHNLHKNLFTIKINGNCPEEHRIYTFPVTLSHSTIKFIKRFSLKKVAPWNFNCTDTISQGFWGTFCTEFYLRSLSGTRIYTHGSMKDSGVTENARRFGEVDVEFSVGGTIKVFKNAGSAHRTKVYPSGRSGDRNWRVCRDRDPIYVTRQF